MNQQAYINCSVQCWTDLNPLEMLDTISEIETIVGRKRSGKKWESRIIDIDILLWGKQVIEQPRLTIPHYDLSNRDFFLIPLLELDNTLIHPCKGDFLLTELEKIPPLLLTHPVKIKQDCSQTYHKFHQE
jgi:2-amino-4-hydroxy-6-hydroxymethyldihydropteridine diphosphokinase